MPVELLNPDGLPKPECYAQVGVATGSTALAAVGGGFDDVAELA